MKAIFYPTDHSTNKYGQIIAEGLLEKGVELIPYEKSFKNYKLFKSIEIVHLNWFETLGKSTFEDAKRFVGRAIKLSIFKIFGKKIIWTFHNRMPHQKNNILLKKTITDLLVRYADKIIIHSKISENILLSNYPHAAKKITYVPHPNYIDCYPVRLGLVNQEIKDKSKLHLLFVGAVKPYKNIELLIDTAAKFQNDIVLTVAGKASSSLYAAQLMDYSKNLTNLNLVLEFIPDDLIADYILKCDLLILPYDINSSLNSGTVILAFSSGKTVICPNIGTISDVEDDSLILSYNYNSSAEHQEVICSKIEQAIAMKRSNGNVFEEMGIKLYDYVKVHNDKDKVVNQIKEIYYELLSA